MTITDAERRECEQLAVGILRSYFCDSDVSPLLDSMTDDVVWMGGGEKQYAEGKEAVAAFFLREKEALMRFRMWEERYVTVKQAEGLYLCEAQSRLESTNPGTLMRIVQRCTFLFRRENGRLRSAHIHNSVPFSGIQDDELFPIRRAQKDYDQLKALVSDQERQIELMLRQMPGGMQICYVDGAFTTKWISDGLLTLLGFDSVEQYMGEAGSCRNFILQEDYESMCREVDEAFRTGDSYSVEYRVRRRDGSLFWMLDMGNRFVDGDGETVIGCFMSDITSRVEREERLRRAHTELMVQTNFLQRLYDTVPCGIIQFSTESPFSIINANRRAGEIFGYSQEEYLTLARDPFRSVRAEDLDWVRNLVMKAIARGGQMDYEREAVKRDGSTCFISVSMERLVSASGVTVVQAVFSDISEMRALQQEREQEQIQENQWLRTAIYTAYRRIIHGNLTRNTYSCFVDKGFINSVESCGEYDCWVRQTAGRIHPTQREAFLTAFDRGAVLAAVAGGKQEVFEEVRELGSDGAYHWISVHMIRVSGLRKTPAGEQDVQVIFLLKLLDQQRAEKMRQEQILRDALAGAESASRAKSDFLSRMSHDIRTPLNAIIGMSTLAMARHQEGTDVIDCVEKIEASAHYLLSLINDVLDMSRIESGKMVLNNQPFSLQALLEQINSIIAPQAESRRLRYELVQSGELDGSYVADELRVNQILMNLLSNALKFTLEGGHVVLALREWERTDHTAGLEFQVSDTGAGMSPAFLERIGRPFEQENPGVARDGSGSGLGLSIVYNLVQLMGGTIRIESKQGVGSRFTVVLPMGLTQNSREEPASPGSETPLIPEHKQSGRLLLVEDNRLNMEIATELLVMSGYEVDQAENGQIAVEKVRDHTGDYDAVLMDIRMPVMDGLEATRQIRALPEAETGRLPIIAMSANAFEEDRMLAREAGMDAYLMKPIDLPGLLSTLDRFLNNPAAE